jgi:antitoxin (DNA-binding transcriptional repressor) of toxin-antitoxin stability system
MRHIGHMKTATSRELHMNTGKLVHASAHENILITDRGQAVAVLKSARTPDVIGKPFPKPDIRKMPKSNVDSTIYISQDRDGR